MSKRLTVERLPGPEALEDVAAEWELLDRETSPRTPFTSPAWILAWWKHFPRRRQTLFNDEFYCHVVRGPGRRLVAIAPLMRTFSPGFGPPILRMVQFFGADPALTEVRGLICRRKDEAAAVDALVEHFLAHRDEWDVFRWAGLGQAADSYFEARPPSSFVPRGNLPDYIIDLPDSWERLHARISSNMRRKLRKSYELLAQDGFAFTVRVIERPDEAEAAMERFFALHAARAEAADMLFHENKFQRPHARAFFYEYARCAAKRGDLRIFQLEIGGEVIASRLAVLLGSDMWMHLSGHDPAWRDYGVMAVLTAEMIKWSFAQGIERVNLSTGADQSKAGWRPREVLFRDAVQTSPALRARTAFFGFQTYEALRHARGGAILRVRALMREVVGRGRIPWRGVAYGVAVAILGLSRIDQIAMAEFIAGEDADNFASALDLVVAMYERATADSDASRTYAMKGLTRMALTPFMAVLR